MNCRSPDPDAFVFSGFSDQVSDDINRQRIQLTPLAANGMDRMPTNFGRGVIKRPDYCGNSFLRSVMVEKGSAPFSNLRIRMSEAGDYVRNSGGTGFEEYRISLSPAFRRTQHFDQFSVRLFHRESPCRDRDFASRLA